ncbi:cytochrome c maturation protein CcmE, partial [Salmonella sp. SAL4360]|uniref:cytochrome c maturation protein CcmE domain-containing protein n=1 Tax=Salmonella sp. SAL4360 TaxID=3159881 RepID=UPI003979DE90
FRVRDIDGGNRSTVTVLYTGSVPDQFKVGRDLVVDGQLKGATFVAVPGSMVTKCPSKYTAKTDAQ